MINLWMAISLWSAHKHFNQRYFTNFFDKILQESEERVELHEKRLLITFSRRKVRKSIIDPFVAMIKHFLCSIFKKSEEKVELHEKRLLLTFWRRRVRRSMIALLVAVIKYLLGLCRNKCQLLDFIQIFQRIFEKSEEKVELHEKRLLLTFWRKRVRKSMIALLVAVIKYLLGLCRNKCQLLDFIKIF